MQKNTILPNLINNCINNITKSGIWKPLPERENEIDQINLFIEQSFKNRTPSSLIVSGPKSCGKTAVLHTCALMSEFANQIFFFDCQNSDAFNINFTINKNRQLVILDNFSPQFHQHNDVIPFFRGHNCSVIIVMQQYEKNNNFSIFPVVSCINFSIYSLTQIQNILFEYMGELSSFIERKVISEISSEVYRNNGSISDAFQMLLNFLQQNLLSTQ